MLSDLLACVFDAFAHQHRISALLNGLQAILDHVLRQDRRRRRSIACRIIGLVGDFIDELCAHVFKLVFQFDLLGDRYAVIGDQRRTIFLLQHDIASLRTKRYSYCVSQRIHALEHRLTRIL